MTTAIRPAQPIEVNTDVAYSAAITLPGDTRDYRNDEPRRETP